MPGFNPVVHLLFQEAYADVCEYLFKNPATKTPNSWDLLVSVHDDLQATLEAHPVRFIVLFN
jgi:hypothetical protein